MEALAFLDLLGFSQMVTKDKNLAKEVLSDFYNITFRLIRDEPRVKGNLFSDSLLAYSQDPAILVNIITKIYRECLLKNGEYDQMYDLSKYFLLPRGGISFGHVDIQERNESPNLTKNFIVSPALVHSAKIESGIKGSRLLIADEELSENQVFNWNPEIRSVMYENSTFQFWAGSKYYDSLWFLDLNKSLQEQKEEVEELINCSLKLVRANHKSKKATEQHVQTLRIGLLSYSKFLSPNGNPLIEQIVGEFEKDDYWMIWLTLIEMIMNSPDNWAFEGDDLIVPFFKRINLKLGWAKIVIEINKPNNVRLFNLFEEFQNRLNN